MVNNVFTASKLNFFKCEIYNYNQHNTFDTSNCPRPHFCMGLVLSGTAKYKDCSNDRIIEIEPGDIIFVPIKSCYVSNWTGFPNISYISMHFSFEDPSFFTTGRQFELQKIKPDNFEHTKNIFEFVLENFDKNEILQLSSMGKFFEIISHILPKLKSQKTRKRDSRISGAIEYIEKNYENKISIEQLASASNMSVSRFFHYFKKAEGVTPIEYINNHRINRSIIILLNNSNISIEELSGKVGYDSAAYFRRIFKKITGKTPREYKSSGIEI